MCLSSLTMILVSRDAFSRGVGVLSVCLLREYLFELSLTRDSFESELVRNVTRVRAATRTALIDMCVVPQHIISTFRELEFDSEKSKLDRRRNF